MTRFARSWMCAAAPALSTLAAGPVAADPVTDARAAWEIQDKKTGADSAEAVGTLMKLLDALDAEDDVSSVYSNENISDEDLAKYAG